MSNRAIADLLKDARSRGEWVPIIRELCEAVEAQDASTSELEKQLNECKIIMTEAQQAIADVNNKFGVSSTLLTVGNKIDKWLLKGR